MNKDAIETALLGHPRGLATLFFYRNVGEI